jgi:hypothetical protein
MGSEPNPGPSAYEQEENDGPFLRHMLDTTAGPTGEQEPRWLVSGAEAMRTTLDRAERYMHSGNAELSRPELKELSHMLSFMTSLGIMRLTDPLSAEERTIMTAEIQRVRNLNSLVAGALQPEE